MTRIALLAAVLAVGCTGTYYPYPSQPAYAAAQTQQVSQSQDGTTTTTTTETYQFQSSAAVAPNAPVAQPAVYQQPADDEYNQPPSLCHRRDTPNMCVAVAVIVDIGDILTDVHDASCRDAARALNRYADSHAREIDTLVRLRELESPARLAGWEERHRSRAEGVMVAAMDLDTRCQHNAKVDRALRRVGFTGIIGSPARLGSE